MFSPILMEYWTDLEIVVLLLQVSKLLRELVQTHLIEITSSDEKRKRVRLSPCSALQTISPQIQLMNMDLSQFPSLRSVQLLFSVYYESYPRELTSLLKRFQLSQKLPSVNLTLTTPTFWIKSLTSFSTMESRVSLKLSIHENILDWEPSNPDLFEGLDDFENKIPPILMQIARIILSQSDQLKMRLTHPKFAEFISDSGWFRPDQLIFDLKPVPALQVGRIHIYYFSEPGSQPLTTRALKSLTGEDSILASLFHQSSSPVPSEVEL